MYFVVLRLQKVIKNRYFLVMNFMVFRDPHFYRFSIDFGRPRGLQKSSLSVPVAFSKKKVLIQRLHLMLRAPKIAQPPSCRKLSWSRPARYLAPKRPPGHIVLSLDRFVLHFGWILRHFWWIWDAIDVVSTSKSHTTKSHTFDHSVITFWNVRLEPSFRTFSDVATAASGATR